MPRNSSGTYTLPAGNPVAPNTLIETNWANPTLSDVASGITDSLDRLGRGTMLAPLKLFDGTAIAPALSFNSEATTGIYRPAANSLGISVSGGLVARFTAASVDVLTALSVTGALSLTGAVNIAGAMTLSGPVGIGAAPVAPYRLDISHTAAAETRLRSTSPTSYASAYIGNDIGTPTRALSLLYSGSAYASPTIVGGPVGEQANLATLGAFPLVLGTNNIARLTLDANSGHIGAGALPLAVVGVNVSVQARAGSGAAGVGAFSAAADSYAMFYSGINAADNPSIVWNSTSGLRFGTSTGTGTTGYVELARISGTGTVAVGVVPSPWSPSNYKAIDLHTRGLSVVGGADSGLIAQGVYNDGAWRYKGTTAFGVTREDFFDGGFVWSNAPAGAANAPATFVGRMWLTAAGNVGIGAAPGGAGLLEVVRSSTICALLRTTSNVGYTSLRLYNDVNNASRALEIDYSGSGYGSSLIIGAPVGEVGTVATTGNVPLVLGSFNTARIIVYGNGITDFPTGSGTLRIGGGQTRFSSEVACPAVAGAASLTTVAHGGPRVPDYFRVLVRCAVAEFGYVPGDYVELVSLPGTATYSTAANATQIRWWAPATVSGPPVIYIANGTNALATVTAANWRLAFFALWL